MGAGGMGGNQLLQQFMGMSPFDQPGQPMQQPGPETMTPPPQPIMDMSNPQPMGGPWPGGTMSFGGPQISGPFPGQPGPGSYGHPFQQALLPGGIQLSLFGRTTVPKQGPRPEGYEPPIGSGDYGGKKSEAESDKGGNGGFTQEDYDRLP